MSFSQVSICCIIFGSLVVHLACWTFEDAPSVTRMVVLSFKSERRRRHSSFCLFPLVAGIGPGFVCNRSYDQFHPEAINLLSLFLYFYQLPGQKCRIAEVSFLVFYTIQAKSRQNLIVMQKVLYIIHRVIYSLHERAHTHSIAK